MVDFLTISTRSRKRGIIEIYPKFIIKKSSDLMIRGGDFYAIWIEERSLWSTDEQDALQIIDRELDKYAEENSQRLAEYEVHIMHMWDSETGMIDAWHRYCQKQMRDSFHMLDERLIFSNTTTTKKDYASKRLSYPLEPGDAPAYEKLISTLYSEEERRKIEWAIGSIVSGESKHIQKFMVLYGAVGTGKSTVINIIQQLFEGYWTVFNSKTLGSANSSFALEAFRTNPLVAIEHDGDLSHVEDNTRINSLVSHETMMVNEKFKSAYPNQFKCFLFMGTNKPVKISDAKSGLLRRLIDVSPSGNKLELAEYNRVTKQIKFELGAIAWHCQEVFLSDPDAYNDYIPVAMLSASNDFYNFVIDSYHVFKKENGTTLKAAWEMYKTYCDEAKVQYPFSQRVFKEELKNYFWDYKDRFNTNDGSRVRSYYTGFRTDKFESGTGGKAERTNIRSIEFKEQSSIFDEIGAEYPAQYASSKGIPKQKWSGIRTTLSEIDTSKLHYVKVPENHIVIDFDIPDKNGNKSFEKNLEEASKWPPTYAELSKSGAGIHLHYIYTGDVSTLSSVYKEHIEVKVFTGDSSLRRMLTKCNNVPVASISSGLPLKGEKMVSKDTIKSERSLRKLIKRNLNKEIHPGTKPSVDFIFKILEDAYTSGMKYDVTDMRGSILAFAANSTNHADYCIKLVNKMHFKSEETSLAVDSEKDELVFYDVEVFPNLFLVNWKVRGKGKSVTRMINPRPEDIEDLMKFRLVGFNCRRYDNHILYARLMGYDNQQLFNLSQKIVSGSQNCFFGEAYNISYTDVYDFASSGNKKSLKKFEIELGIHHQELGLPWDQPVPEHLWTKVAEYCDNDVLATEAVFDHLTADWTARQILADLAGMTVNDTTNTLTTRIIFGNDRHPQDQFHYRDLSKPVTELDDASKQFLQEACPEMMDHEFTAGDGNESYLPYFPGYKYENGKSIYRGEEVGEGGYAYSEPGMYGNVALLDIASMHPHSAIAEILFGVKHTRAFREVVEGRVSIKHEAWNEINTMLNGKLTPHIQRVINGEMSSGDLANALKTAINSVYGLTAANFENAFQDPRNVDNIVAKRGALFMIDLKHAVQERGFTVAHIKTDSIKIPDATSEIIQFVMDFGKRYGYSFEHEATYDRMCIVNKSTYIAKYASQAKCEQLYGYIPGDNKRHPDEWTATAEQFQTPYVFKTLFSKDSISFEDMCETFEVKQGSLYLDMNEDLPDVSENEKELKKLLKLDPECERVKELQKIIETGHNYHFVGRVGQFTPIKAGCGGGVLYRINAGKNYAAAGSTGYRWMESEMVRTLEKDEDIDQSFFDKLVTDAKMAISLYGDFEWFVSDDPYIGPDFEMGKYMNHPVYLDEVPFDEQ